MSTQLVSLGAFQAVTFSLPLAEVDQVIRIQTKDIESAPQRVLESHNYIKGIAKSEEKLIVLLDVAKLLEDSSSIQETIRGNQQ